MSRLTEKTKRSTPKSSATRLTEKQKCELAALAAMPDNQIDTSGIPELPPDAWKNAVRRRFCRPSRRQKSFKPHYRKLQIFNL
jgi:hypothetical protein